MRATINQRRRRSIAFAAAAGAILCAVLIPSAASAGTVAKTRSCRDVVVQFEPEGSGGAAEIRTRRIKCRPARRVLRRCIKGKLSPGWSGVFADSKFVLSKGRKRIRYLPVGGGGCIPVAKNRGGSDRPHAPQGADRVESFSRNLGGSGASERVLVYNLPKGGFPASWFEVWHRKHGDWVRGQRELVEEIPSNPSAGLVRAWVADLNRDGRVEIAVRDSVSPSFGETLSIFRQRSSGSLRFSDLQRVGGDGVGVRTRKGKRAVLKIFRKSNHSPDGVEHHETWKWSQRADAWGCSTDCAALAASGA